jgi:hypothetical protein
VGLENKEQSQFRASSNIWLQRMRGNGNERFVKEERL